MLLVNAIENSNASFDIDIRKINSERFDFQWTHWEFSIANNELGILEVLGTGHKIEKSNEKNMDFPKFIHEPQVKNEIMEGLFEDNEIGFRIWDLKNAQDLLSISLSPCGDTNRVTIVQMTSNGKKKTIPGINERSWIDKKSISAIWERFPFIVSLVSEH